VFALAVNYKLQCTSIVRKTSSKITKRARSGSRPRAPGLLYEEWLIGRLVDPAEAAAYLDAVLEQGDQAAIMVALRQVAMARGGIAHIARKARLTREATYKMLSKAGNPELRSLSAVLEAAGLRISVKPIEKKAA
jgi:probable addiction module antidote protein